ncbi:MAG TPA: DUF2304 domain-containing protein [Candidatus Magasanikbacteria bacterium]|nr:DUF2304 domain-containing protein [Candidatus Magasanikbacteria bacterium]
MRIIFQLAIAILSLIAIMSVLRRKKEHLLGPLGALFWIIFWVALISIVSLPTTLLDRFSQFIGIGRGVDLVMYVSIAILFFVVFKLYIRIESMRRDMTEIARKKTIDSISERK